MTWVIGWARWPRLSAMLFAGWVLFSFTFALLVALVQLALEEYEDRHARR